MVPRLTWPRSRRLRQRRDFSRLRQNGRRLARRELVLNWQERSVDGDSRMAVITTRRLGNAVVRNRARRLLRECFRRNQHALCKPVDMVLVARSGLVGAGLAQAETAFLGALREANLLSRQQ